ncbi:MAG TPA: hypothetical protein PLK12_15135 [Prolixibacteraceae bacterium]|nr:hypothetical protein [Prolixibacteraceae bacterium]
MKKLGFILFIFLPCVLCAQNELKELLSKENENDRFSNLMLLKQYQGAHPEHALAYYRIAGIYTQYMEETDPLRQFFFIKSNYYEARVNYELCLLKLEDSQARRDRDYFGEIPILSGKRKAQPEDIRAMIETRLDSLKKYYHHAESVHLNYIRCINKYNECLYGYREIVRNYPNYKDMYLLADSLLIGAIEKLALDFDSSLVYFGAYQNSCARLPHLLKVNNYTLKTIVTYRLEGLIESDFSQPLVSLWDFKSWAREFLDIYRRDLLYIRKEMTALDEQLDQQIQTLKEKEAYTDEADVFYPDDKFLNLIGKYDPASLANELFLYKKAKIAFLSRTRECINDPKSTRDEYLINRLNFYKELAFRNEDLNSEAEKLKQSVNIDDIGKYLSFFNERYRGMDGLTRWCEVEKYDNNSVLLKNIGHLSLFLENESMRHNFRDSVLNMPPYRIAYGIQQPLPDSLGTDTFLVTGFEPFSKKQAILSGLKIEKDSTRSPFLLKTGKEKQVEWVYFPNLARPGEKKQALPVFHSIRGDSTCVVLYYVETDTQTTHCIIETLSPNGTLKQTIHPGLKDYPRFFSVDEINEEYWVLTQGRGNNSFSKNTDTLTVALYRFDGNPVWIEKYLIGGSFADGAFLNADLLVACNVFSFDDGKGRSYTTGDPDRRNPLCIFISRQGETKGICRYEFPGSSNIELFKKLNSNLFHYSGRINETPGVHPFYMLTNSRGEPVFTTEAGVQYHSDLP